jgi:hypothetical protein
MAVVGEAKIIVRAITTGFKEDIQNASRGVGGVGEKAGKDYGNGVNRGFSQSIGGFTERNLDIFEVSRRQFRRLSIATNIVVPAIAGLVGIIGNLVSGLVILVAAAGSAAKAVGIALLGSIVAVAQAAITLGVAFKGFGEAMKQANGSSSAAANAARAEEAALRRLRDARLNLKRIIEEEAPEALADARERAADAADNAAAAVRNEERAQRAYVDTQKESLDAQEDLNKAREDAKEKLQQLRFELEGAAIGEKRARLEFEKARDSLQAVQDLPPNSRARQEAELNFAQAELNLRKAIDSNSDLKKEEDAATKAGVEGSDDVVKAKERIAKATQAETDAAIDAALAIKAAADAQKEAAQAAIDASAGGRVERELQRRIAAAREQVRDAEQAVEDARRSASSSANQIKVTPAQLAFAKYLKSLSEEFFKLRVAAGIDLFPRLEIALGNIVRGLFPTLEVLLRNTGKTLGDIAVGFSEVVTEGENVSRLQSVWSTNDRLLTSFGNAAGNLYSALLLLLEAAEPVILAFGEWAESSSADFLARLAREGDEVRKKFERNLEIFQQLARITEDLKETFGNLGAAINIEGGGTDILLGFIEEATQKWSDFTGSVEGQDFLQQFFKDSATNFTELLTLVALIGQGFLKLGASEGIGDLLVSLQNITIAFNDLGQELSDSGALTAFGEAGEEFVKLLILLTDTGAITVFFETLRDIFKFLNIIFGSPVVQAILGFLAPILAVALAFGLVFRSIRFVFRALFGFVRLIPGAKNLFKGISQGFKGSSKAAEKSGSAVKNFGRSIGTAIRGIPGKLKTLGIKFANSFLKFASNAVSAFSKLPGKIGTALKPILSVVGNLLRSLGTYLFQTVPRYWGQAFMNGLTAVRTALAPILNVVGNLLRSLGTYLTKTVPQFWGQAFRNAFTAVRTALSTFLSGVGGRVLGFFRGLPGVFMGALKAIPGNIMSFLARLGPILLQGILRIGPWILRAVVGAIAGIPGAIILALVTIGYLIYKYWDEIVAWFKNLGSWFSEWGSKFWDWLKEAWDNYWKYQKERLDSFIDFFKNLPENLARIGRGMWDWLKNTFKDALNWVIDRWNNWRLDVRIPSNDFTIATRLAGKGFSIETPNIPRLAMGGVVYPRSGGTLAMIAEAGRAERVEPLDASGLSKRDRAMINMLGGGGGATINVYPSPGMNERELADMVSRRLAYQMRRGAV